ncbi:MAG: DUF4364 family protein [Ruminococcaceae bacterium]|nr:DUF4364 family protein [Oscillospiraceae bacterium]
MREKKNNENPFVPGMLTNIMDIKILICYLLLSLGEPLDKEQMIEMLFENDIAEYFDLRAAVMQLVENGNIAEDAQGNLTLTDSGKEAAEQLESSLPFSVREKAVREGLKIATLSKRIKANKAEIEKNKNGIFVNCELKDDEEPALQFRILVADEMQAKMLQQKFLENPAAVYKTIINTIINNE